MKPEHPVTSRPPKAGPFVPDWQTLDPRKLEVPGHQRLETDFGKPVGEIIA